jgi:hypothetical protein
MSLTGICGRCRLSGRRVCRANRSRVRLALALENGDCSQEENAGCDGHEDDGVAVGGLGFGWSSSGVITALGAALGVGRDGEQGEEEQRCQTGAFHFAVLIICLWPTVRFF